MVCKGPPASVVQDIGVVGVVHRRAADGMQRKGKTAGFNDVDGKTQARAKPYDRAKVRGNIGLDQGKAHGGADHAGMSQQIPAFVRITRHRAARFFSLRGLKSRVSRRACSLLPEVATMASSLASFDDAVTRRDFIHVATAVAGASGVAALSWPFIDQFNPSAATRAIELTELDLSAIFPGQTITVLWQGKPVFVRHRTQNEIARVEATPLGDLIDTANVPADDDRVKWFEGTRQKQWLIVLAACTHLGCIPKANHGVHGGWFCYCHGSQYDASGRVRVGPAPENLKVPPYRFVSATQVIIGEDAAPQGPAALA